MTNVDVSFAPWAFVVVAPGCAVGNLSFAHELGHVMGANHDWYVDTNTAPYYYAHGFVDTAARTRSVMAYNNQCAASGFNCTRLPQWSNPAQNFGIAEAAGQPRPADNRKALNNTGLTVANFRCDPSQLGTLDSTLQDTSIKASDGHGNFWYLDRRSQPVTVAMTNSGTIRWDARFALVLAEPANNKNATGGPLLDLTRVPLAAGEIVEPGSTKVFSFSFVGVGRADRFVWQMEGPNGRRFGVSTPSVVLQPKGF